MNFSDPIFDIPRVFIYFWAIIESAWLMGLYFVAYKSMKDTPIIKYLTQIFVALTFLLIINTISAIAHVLNVKFFEILILFHSIPLLYLIYSLAMFRKQSLTSLTKKD